MTSSPISSFDKISPTALIVAHARQFCDISYTSEIAKQVNTEAFTTEFAAQAGANLAPMTALVEGRYKAINALMAQHSHHQILELASGLLPRGMIMTQNSEMTFVESDLPAMIAQKQKIVRQLVGDRANLHLMSIDATQPFPELPFRSSYPVTVICEGLLSYLSLSEKAQVFNNVRTLLEQFGGVWITPDPSTLQRLQKLSHIPALQGAINALVKMTDRNVGSSGFRDFDHFKQFALEQGFHHIEAHSMITVIDQLKCFEHLNIDVEIAKALLEATPVFVLST